MIRQTEMAETESKRQAKVTRYGKHNIKGRVQVNEIQGAERGRTLAE